MFTESSKPTMAKKARAVAAVTALKAVLPSATFTSVRREKSPSPWKMAHIPTTITISRPDSSMQVSTTLTFTDSETPRSTTSITISRKAADSILSSMPCSSRCQPIIAAKLPAKALEADAEEVRPEHITVKATMKVKKWLLNARCV